jgi:Uma2 family endonuclease
MQSKPVPLSPAEYLEREKRSSAKSEYVDGEIYAMTGASRRHNLIASNIQARAWNAASGTGCQVFGSDMKVYVEAHNNFYYPDISVCCDQTDTEERFLTKPCFIVEVLSPSTANIDRREKRASYATLESLREYVIVDQDRMRVELYRREGTAWRGYVLNQASDAFESSCLQLKITLAQVYEGVEIQTGVAETDAPEYSDRQ